MRVRGAGVGVTLGYVVRGLCALWLGVSRFQFLQMRSISVSLGSRLLCEVVESFDRGRGFAMLEST